MRSISEQASRSRHQTQPTCLQSTNKKKTSQKLNLTCKQIPAETHSTQDLHRILMTQTNTAILSPSNNLSASHLLQTLDPRTAPKLKPCQRWLSKSIAQTIAQARRSKSTRCGENQRSKFKSWKRLNTKIMTFQCLQTESSVFLSEIKAVISWALAQVSNHRIAW